jgi:D-alanyl-D-alanine carboxypeptidase
MLTNRPPIRRRNTAGSHCRDPADADPAPTRYPRAVHPRIPISATFRRARGRAHQRGHARLLLAIAAAATLTGCGVGPVAAVPPVHAPRVQAGGAGTALRGAARTGASPTSSQPAPQASGATASRFLDAAVRARLSTELLRLRASHHLPGIQAVVRLPDGEAWIAHAGYADVATHTEISTTTLFDAGSITKTFVATLTLQLADQGVLALDDPVTRWLPAFTAGRGVTIRELLDHTSGIGEPFNRPALLAGLGSAPGRAWTPAAVLRYAARPRFTPGQGWLYSNANYLLLGQIIQAATGTSVPVLLQKQLLGPLGLDHTFLQGPPPPPASAARAHGYDATTDAVWPTIDLSRGSAFEPFRSLATALGTAGGLVTTADDLSRWAEALYGGHVLPAPTLTRMLDFGLTAGLRPRWPYGLGVQRVVLGGQVAWGHSGLLSGFHAAMRYFPATGATIVVLVNADATNPDTLVSGLLGALGPLPLASR